METKKQVVKDNKTGHRYLVIENASNTLATMVMLGEVKIYWLNCWYSKDGICYLADEVTNPQTIWGACPSCFGIMID